jgi:hypothetical protein
MVSDIVLLRELPSFIRNSLQALTGCIAGALMREDYLEAIRSAGFEDVTIVAEGTYSVAEDEAMIEGISRQLKIPKVLAKQAADNYVSSIKVSATAPEK